MSDRTTRQILALAAVFLLLAAGPGAAVAAEQRVILSGTRYQTTLHIIEGPEPGPTVWVSGGVHGSELAGWMAADQIKDWAVGRGRLVVLPRANVPAVNNRTRSGPGDPDLNRQFPQRSGQSPKTSLARGIWDQLRSERPDWLIDLHEALGNRNLQSDSVGQTFISCGDRTVPQRAMNTLNQGVSSRNRFQLIRNPVLGSLARSACDRLGISGGIFETWRSLPLQQRIDYQLDFVENMLDELGMEPRREGSARAPGGLPELAGEPSQGMTITA